MRTAIGLILCCLLGAAGAADDAPLTYDRITLSVSAERQVANDTIVAELYSEREDEQVSAAASEVNRNIAWALELAADAAQVSVQTTGYHSQPIYREQTAIGWRVRQSIRLQSRDTTRLSELIGVLQERLAIATIAYTISPDLRAEAEDSLIAQALGSFDARARLITKELARPGYRVVNMDVVTSRTPMRPRPGQRMALSMEAAGGASPPALESGTQRVGVQVNGTIELKLN